MAKKQTIICHKIQKKLFDRKNKNNHQKLKCPPAMLNNKHPSNVTAIMVSLEIIKNFHIKPKENKRN